MNNSTRMASEVAHNMSKTSISSSGMQSITPSPPLSFVRIPLLVVGAGRMANFACHGECVLHRTGQWYRARRWLFQNVLGDKRGIRVSRMPVAEPLITVA
jgi:hypothetical protein